MFCIIEKFTHHFTISNMWPAVHNSLLYFIKDNLTEYSMERVKRRFVVKQSKLYATRCEAGKKFRMHINHFDDLMSHFSRQGIPSSNFKIKEMLLHEPRKVTYKLAPGKSPFDYQEPLIDFITDEGFIKVISLQMGQGKTYTALNAASKVGTLLFIQVLSRYVSKWKKDVQEIYRIDKKKILTIQGMKAELIPFMKKYYDQPKRNQYDVIIMSTDTMIKYILDYERNPNIKREKWYIPPHEFYQRLGIGQKIVDEVHQLFQWNFKVELYCNIPKVTYLSATLDDLDNDMDIKMYNILLPSKLRRDGGALSIYTDVISYHYYVKDFDRKIKSQGANGYSHTMFEKSMMANPNFKQGYYNMLKDIIYNYYILRKLDGQKALMFFSLTEVCADFRDYLRKIHPTLEINKYTSEDDFSTFDNSDIINSTLGSSGTAIDVPNLITCVMTVALSKAQANLQAFGRLRKIKTEGSNSPIFIYLVCISVPKHLEYDKKKRRLLTKRASNMQVEHNKFTLTTHKHKEVA